MKAIQTILSTAQRHAHMSDEGVPMEERLSKMLSGGGDWERTPTSIPGVMIIRMPQYKSRAPTLALELNPVDASGAATKKRGMMIRSADEVREIAKIVGNEDMIKLAQAMDVANPTSLPKQSSDVFRV